MSPANLGRYGILKELGRGAIGRVLLARAPEDERPVAIKIVEVLDALPDSERADARARFMREAAAVRRLTHPAIVRSRGAEEADGKLFVVTEYVEGTPLDVHCRPENLLPVKTVIELVLAAAEGLDAAHQAGVVHRDVKPANLLRVGDTGVKITDFALALPSGARLTRDDAPAAVPSYMSPEQIRGEEPDGRSDLFSLAAVLFALLTGEMPFPGDSVSSVAFRIINEEPREPRQRRPGFTRSLSSFLGRALSKRPEDRFATGQEFAAALREAGAEVPSADAPSSGIDPAGATSNAGGDARVPLAAPTRRAKRSSVRPFVLAAILFVTILGAAGYLYREQRVPEPVAPPEPVWIETRVRTEPPGIPLLLDGLEIESGGPLRYTAEGPLGLLTAEKACRRAEHRLAPEDAGGEVVLVLDPAELAWQVDPGVEDAALRLNGKSAGKTPGQVNFDLCRENTLEIRAEGYRPGSLELPAGITPLEARSLLAALTLEAIPMGRLLLEKGSIDLIYYVDGKRKGRAPHDLQLEEGRHEVRFKNEYHWIDAKRPVEITGGETLKPDLEMPAMTSLVVQAFPANCKVYMRRPGGQWRYLDDTPMTREVAAGSYQVKVELNPTGETRVRDVVLRPGQNPPVRISFRGDG